jgi:hypothetical protein
MKYSKLALSLGCIVALSLALAMPTMAGDELDGKTLFKDNCKVCHGKDSPDDEYTPMTLIQDQWERFCDKKYQKKHPELDHPTHKGKTLEDVITEEMLEAICDFAIEHAADSESPMTCG